MSATKAQRMRGRYAALTRSRHADDPEVQGAKSDLAVAKLEQYVAKVVADAPPLTAEQRDRIAALLRPAPKDGDAL